MQLHAITGLPRAGSTLLCNLLNQNPAFWATSTSVLPQSLNRIIHGWSNSVEIKNLLEKDKEGTEGRMHRSMKSFIDGWHTRNDGRNIIFDKSRGWCHNALLLKRLYPESKLIICVRDLRNVFASIEKQHRKNPLLDEAQCPADKTVYTRADQMFSAQGIIGSCLEGISDVMRRGLQGIIYVQYETLASNPKMVMERLYEELKLPYFEHDFKNVKSTSIDCDGHYLHKYPHKGEGEVKASDPSEWRKYISKDIAQNIMTKFNDYNQFFGYQRTG